MIRTARRRIALRVGDRLNAKGRNMTAQEFAAKLGALIAEARATGVPDDEIIILLQDATDGLEAGLA
jgi:hypothetical protein